jgi:hypothetical protein
MGIAMTRTGLAWSWTGAPRTSGGRAGPKTASLFSIISFSFFLLFLSHFFFYGFFTFKKFEIYRN